MLLGTNIVQNYETILKTYGLWEVMWTSFLFASLPTIIIFFLLQKSFTEGIAGAVK